MTEFLDPPPPPDPGERMKAADLKNKVVLLRPTKHDVIDGKPDPKTGEVKPWEFVECDVWVLDRVGIVEQDRGIRISWWRAVAQLCEAIGSFVACKPLEQEDRSVILASLVGESREVATQAIKEIEAAPAVNEEPPVSHAENEEPF